MASSMILARFSRNGASSLNRLISARPEPRLCVPVYQFSSFSSLLNGTFQRKGFSSKACDKEAELMREHIFKLLEKYDKLRGYAEMENVMNRTKREAENSQKFAIQSFAKDLLDIADNLEKASSIVKKIFAKTDEKEFFKASLLVETLLEGVEMTNKQLSKVFKKFGVEKYDAQNKTFDPHRHYVVYEVPYSSKPPGTVVVVIRDGYMLHERVLRPAEVGVTKSSEGSSEYDKLRGYAEMKNVMNRTKREAENSQKFAIQSFAKDLLVIAENLERASLIVKKIFEKKDEKELDKATFLLETLMEGVEMINKQLSKVFKKFGVEKYGAQNETFDPHRHNAVFEVLDPSKLPGTVAGVIKDGYMLRERVLRPAEVAVTKSLQYSSE